MYEGYECRMFNILRFFRTQYVCTDQNEMHVILYDISQILNQRNQNVNQVNDP